MGIFVASHLKASFHNARLRWCHVWLFVKEDYNDPSIIKNTPFLFNHQLLQRRVIYHFIEYHVLNDCEASPHCELNESKEHLWIHLPWMC